MNLVALLHLIVAAGTVLIALPLIARWVPMNRWYGVRVSAAFESDEQWYAINAYGGWVMLVWGLFIAAVAGGGLLLNPRYWDLYTWLSLAVIVGSLAGAVLLILRRSTFTAPTGEQDDTQWK